jgi:hypothetical protein
MSGRAPRLAKIRKMSARERQLIKSV